MDQVRKGGCLCGQLRYRIATHQGMFLRCHCRDCRQISGAGHLPQLVVARSAIAISGKIATYQWLADSGNRMELGFCASCASPIYKTTSMMAESMAITAGTLDDGSDLSEPHVAFADSCQGWDGPFS